MLFLNNQYDKDNRYNGIIISGKCITVAQIHEKDKVPLLDNNHNRNIFRFRLLSRQLSLPRRLHSGLYKITTAIHHRFKCPVMFPFLTSVMLFITSQEKYPHSTFFHLKYFWTIRKPLTSLTLTGKTQTDKDSRGQEAAVISSVGDNFSDPDVMKRTSFSRQ